MQQQLTAGSGGVESPPMTPVRKAATIVEELGRTLDTVEKNGIVTDLEKPVKLTVFETELRRLSALIEQKTNDLFQILFHCVQVCKDGIRKAKLEQEISPFRNPQVDNQKEQISFVPSVQERTNFLIRQHVAFQDIDILPSGERGAFDDCNFLSVRQAVKRLLTDVNRAKALLKRYSERDVQDFLAEQSTLEQAQQFTEAA